LQGCEGFRSNIQGFVFAGDSRQSTSRVAPCCPGLHHPFCCIGPRRADGHQRAQLRAHLALCSCHPHCFSEFQFSAVPAVPDTPAASLKCIAVLFRVCLCWCEPGVCRVFLRHAVPSCIALLSRICLRWCAPAWRSFPAASRHRFRSISRSFSSGTWQDSPAPFPSFVTATNGIQLVLFGM
jgi:hypothetical protein